MWYSVERNLPQHNQVVKFSHCITVTVSYKLTCAEIHDWQQTFFMVLADY